MLNFFLEHPQQPFTLTQVAKSLRLSRATAHSILLSFVNAGYLYRRTDKSYVLGLALPTLAAAALAEFSPLAVAGQEMRALADELDVIASAQFLENGELVVRERAASVNHLGLDNRTPRRANPSNPGANIFRLPLSEPELEAALQRVTPALTPEARSELRAEIEMARKRGFAAQALVNADSRSYDFSEPGYILHDPQPDAEYRLRYMIAPVLDEMGQVAFAISLFGFRRKLSGAEVLEAGASLRAACQRISAFLGAQRVLDPTPAS